MKLLNVLITIANVSLVVRETRSICKEGGHKFLNRNCAPKDFKGLRTSALYCDCPECEDKIVKACSIGKLNRDAVKSAGCKFGTCVTCSTVGSACTDETRCCDGAVGINKHAVLRGICRKSRRTRKCGYCAPTGQTCGTSKQGISCCDEGSGVNCYAVGTTERLCIKNPCSELAKFKCPGINDIEFCRCRDKLNGIEYAQCGSVRGGNCSACFLPGHACKSRDECCQPTNDNLKNECRDNTCQTCFGPYILPDDFNCLNNPKIPCCYDPVFNDQPTCQMEAKITGVGTNVVCE